MNSRVLLGVILGGIFGCIATGATVATVGGGDFAGFVTTWGKYVVSIIIAIGLPFIFSAMARTPAIVAGIVWCDVAAVAITKLIFAPGAPIASVAGYNLVFAVVATLVYAAIAGQHRTVAARA